MSNVKNVIATINAALKENPALIKGMEAVYQFHLKDDVPDTYQLVLRGEESYMSEGASEKSDCTLHMKTDSFIKLAKGKLSGATAVLTGKLKIEGDMGTALKLESILSRIKIP
ncbi:MULTISPECIES: SCP2 sterol-binding domain-containing protein [Clostridia]|uniref:SCP2 sterol-binding domain-containing protein n=1 Tax=Clostridia TaxID=186801 RepID=UPI000EA0F063|nr:MULTISPECIES: SCP2 sterol-binding domain-containing protein [Clostridia]NBJ69589.1 sterol-binding protein [Roseburia sp. 1XD42-34]RKI78350.1 sterol-binding protein [Clostridium sp. 1xD42-85]